MGVGFSSHNMFVYILNILFDFMILLLKQLKM